MCSYLLEGLCAWCHSGTSAAQMGCLVRSFFCFFLTIRLEQPPLQDHRAWWRAVDDPFGSSSFDMGLLSPDTFPPPPPFSSQVLLWNKGSCQEGNPSLLWPRALRLTLEHKWKTCTAQQERSDVRTFSAIHRALKKWARSSQPTLSLWLSITLELVEKSFTVHVSDWRPKNSVRTPVSSVHPHRRYALARRTNEHTKIHSQSTLKLFPKMWHLKSKRDCRPDAGGKHRWFQ